MNTAGWCGAAYIFSCRKFSAPLVNGQNDSSRHIICLDYFFVFELLKELGIVSALVLDNIRKLKIHCF